MELITIIGSGRIGSTVATQIVAEGLDDVTLIDIIEGLPKGEALDIGQFSAARGTDVKVKGSNDYKDMAGSDIVIVSAGFPRKPGMTRMDLLNKNTEIIKQVSKEIAKYAPNSLVLMITNPLDVMTYVALKVTGFPTNRVFGMGGVLDSSRFRSILAEMLNIAPSSIQALVIGEHGESMLPLARYTSVCGIPILEILDEGKVKEAIERTRKIAAEVIALKGATVYAPAQSVVRMVDAILNDRKSVYPVSTYLNGQYGVNGICIGVPVVLGKDGVERIIELKLNDEERSIFMKGVETIKAAISSIGL
ncbi:MAG: malate dehydrogenase [Nitrososphaerales archaeon]|nr:malate dehydrogenase [Nitrososphaerales archaeon]